MGNGNFIKQRTIYIFFWLIFLVDFKISVFSMKSELYALFSDLQGMFAKFTKFHSELSWTKYKFHIENKRFIKGIYY